MTEEEGNSRETSQVKIPNIDLIFDYVVHKKYPCGMSKNDKANLRRLSKHYSSRKGQLYYRHRADRDGNKYREVVVIRNIDEQIRIIKNTHTRSGDSNSARCLRNHLGISRTRAKILEKFYWKNVGRDVRDFILACDNCCRKVKPIHETDVVEEQHPISIVPMPNEVMVQIGVDITNLPKTEDSYCYVVLAVDYFSKWPEARALKEHTAETVAKFLFEDIICRHGCVKIQINDQSKEFVNEVSTKLHKLTGSQQYISAYHNQSIGLVELQNSIIKHS